MSRYTEMSYVEYLEALSRCAEKASPAPFGMNNVIFLNLEWHGLWI